MSVCTIPTKGAPSLRFLQGRRAAMLLYYLICYAAAPSATHLRKHSRLPPFAKSAKDGAPHVLLLPAKSKAWATPPRSDVTMCLWENWWIAVAPMAAVPPFREERERMGHPPKSVRRKKNK